MLWLLAQLDREEALAKGWWNLSMIVLVTLLTVLFFVVMFLLRRWKHRQLNAIEQDRAQRRAGQAGERVDAWQASSERYVDHDKLTEDEDRFRREEDPDETGGFGSSNNPGAEDEEEDRDPYGLFADKPFQEADDEEDDDDEPFDDDDDADWDEEEEEGRQ